MRNYLVGSLMIVVFLTISNKSISQNGKAAIYNKLASSHYNRNDFSGAIRYYGLALELDPSDYSSYIGRAGAYMQIEDLRNCIKDCDKAISLIPAKTEISKKTLADVLYTRGVAKHNLSDYTGAISDYTRCLAYKPNDGEAYELRGYALLNIKKINEACADWKKAISLGISKASEPLKKYCRN